MTAHFAALHETGIGHKADMTVALRKVRYCGKKPTLRAIRYWAGLWQFERRRYPKANLQARRRAGPACRKCHEKTRLFSTRSFEIVEACRAVARGPSSPPSLKAPARQPSLASRAKAGEPGRTRTCNQTAKSGRRRSAVPNHFSSCSNFRASPNKA